MNALIFLVNAVVSIYTWILIVWVIASWLVAFNVINTRNAFVAMLMDFLFRVTEPVLRPIRRILPDMGGLDLSPLILLLLLQVFRVFFNRDFVPLFY